MKRIILTILGLGAALAIAQEAVKLSDVVAPVWKDEGKVEVTRLSGIREISLSWQTGATSLSDATVTVVSVTRTGDANAVSRQSYSWPDYAAVMQAAYADATGAKPADVTAWWATTLAGIEGLVKVASYAKDHPPVVVAEEK